jgi:hypothetical protein
MSAGPSGQLSLRAVVIALAGSAITFAIPASKSAH